MFSLTCEISDMRKLISYVIGATKDSGLNSSSSFIKLTTTEDNIVRAVASDSEHILISQIPIKECTPGTITILAKKFFAILSETADIFRTLVLKEEKEGWIFVKAGRSKHTLPSIKKSAFFDISITSTEQFIELPESRFHIALQHAKSALSNSSNSILSGVHIYLEDSKLSVVGIHEPASHLSETQLKPHTSTINTLTQTIGRRSVDILTRILDTNSIEDIKIFQYEKFLCFENENFLYACRVMSGQYPNYKPIIDQYYHTVSTLNKEELNNANNVVVKAFIDTDDICTIWSFNYDQLVITSLDTQIGHSEINITHTLEGENIKIGLNPTIVGTILDLYSEEEIELFLSGSLSPVKIEWAEGNSTYIHIIIPMRI